MLRYVEVESWELESQLVAEYQRIVERVKADTPVRDLDSRTPNLNEREFEVLAGSVHQSIEGNEPEAGLDRLHTSVFRYVRVVAERESIGVPVGNPLHSVFGELVKTLKREGELESTMAERILKSTISTLEAFNDVCNNRSFAHDNEFLHYHESLLIYQHVATSVRFLDAGTRDGAKDEPEGRVADDVPF